MRTSPVHYIAPSAISIVPNCNGSANDLAVTISRGAKIKVYSPRAGIDKTTDGEYQEWTIAGRNRRLADSTAEYTIYARLSRWSKDDGYLIFAPKVPNGDDWLDKYRYITTDGLTDYGYTADSNTVNANNNYYFVRLGDVSLPDANNQRTVTLDTGILGTQQFNDEWALRPDELPLRIELGCTIGDEDVGQTPYVYWGQSLVLTAMLTEGWTGTDIQRFDRWEIVRNSGDATADNAWNYQQVEGEDTLSPRLMPDGQITLNHARGADDDFNGAVSVTFTILAVGHNADTLQREILRTATINIMAETVEKYELSLSETIVSYDPQTQNYTPSTGVNVGIRATDQRGEVFDMTRGQIANAFLVAEYAPVNSSQWTLLAFQGTSQEAGIANIGREVFALQQSVNVRLMRRITDDGQTVAEKELFRTTIAFVRNGEDSKIREWIYRLNSNAGYNATIGTAGGTAVSGQTDGVDNCLLVDDFVPSGWSDDPTGVSQPGDVEWESWRDYDDENHRWGVFHAPVIHNRYAEDGGTQDMRYQWNQSATTAPSFKANEQNPGSGWQPTVPDRPPGDGYYLWAISAVKKADGTYGTWGNAIRLTGDKGTAGEDGSDREYIYIRQNTSQFSGKLPANISTGEISPQGIAAGSETDKTQDDWVPNGWSDTALPADNDKRYVYMSVREKPAGAGQSWGPFGNPVLWSNWGVRGTDGDGTEYVFIRTQNNVAPVMDSAQTGYASDEFRPTITSASQEASLTEQAQTTDDPKGPNSTYPYEWVATRSKGDAAADGTRQWTKYTGKNNDFTMSLWSRWAEDGVPPEQIYIHTSSYPYNGSTPASVDADGNVPSGWSATPVGVSQQYPYEYRSVRRKINGHWGPWSIPQLDAKWSSDGTSISIKGGADMVIGWNESLPSTDDDGFRCLMNNDDGDDMEVYEIDDWQQLTGSWQGYSANIGDIYLVDGDMWMKQNNTATASSPRWKNLGKIQGPAGNDGKNAVRIDLDNQADIIACREDGTVRFTRIVTVHVSIYDGGSPATAGVSTPQTAQDMEIAGVAPTTFSLVDGLLTVTWQFLAGTTITPGSYTKDITLNYNGESYTAQFSLTSSNTSAVYQLHPNMSEVSFHVDANGNYIPSSQDVYCGYTKTDGGGTQTFPGNNIANLWREGGAPYNIFWRIQLSDGTFSGWRWTKDLPSGILSIDSTTTDIGIEFAMSSAYSISLLSDQNIIDRELVAIVKDGKNGPKGDDAVTYDIVFTEAWAKATPEGVISARLRGHAYKIEGSNRTPLNGATIQYGYNPDDNDTYTDTTTNSQGYFDAETWFDGDELDDYAKGSAVVFVSIIIDGKAVCTKFVTIVQEAADGKPGHVGRWYYYAGDWQSGATYTMQETQAPFVKRGDNFYMLDFGNSGATTGTTQLDPASHYNPVSGQGSKPWTLMQSTMQYYIAQAFFGPYAHFGSFIINGDWLMSTNGTLNGGTYNDGAYYSGRNAYTYFDHASPMGTRNLGISASGITGTTQTQRGSSFTLTAGSRLVKVTCRVTGGLLHVALFDTSGSQISSTQSTTSTSDVELLFNLSLTSDTDVCIKAWMNYSSSSQRGTISSVTVETFAPNFAVDGLTGKTYQNDAYIRGEVHATSGVFNGTVYAADGVFNGVIRASAFYTGSTTRAGDTVINPANGDKSLFIVGGEGATRYKQRITLPSAEQYEGMILRFFNSYVTRSSTSGVIITQGTDRIYIPSEPYADLVQSYQLPTNKVVSFIALKVPSADYCWVLMQ
jgi:hypothetical protein